MKRTILAALLLGAATGMAGAEVIVGYDQSMAEKFEIKREIVDRVQAEFGEYAAYESPEHLPDGVSAGIVAGEALPEGTQVEPVPGELGDLPTLADEGSEWVQAGNHLVEVTDDNRVVMVVYDALP